MGLNIKNPETYRLAQELAELTGESMTTAVTEALRERLARARDKGLVERLTTISKDCAVHLNAPGHKMMQIDDLYDENGLPA
jgi:antitoxin VapB